MRGKTIIELKDVNTGKVKKIEHHNVFQSQVLEQLFKPMGSLSMSMVSGAVDQWKNLVGGLLVLDATIDEGTQYPPQDVNMTANGCYNITNNTDPVELGTWNESESYTSKDEIVMVYDFSTSQGNGKINSVCLTSASGGKAGLGNASQTRLPNNTSRPNFFIKDGGFSRLTGERYFCSDGNNIYVLEKSGTTISVMKRWGNISGIDLIRGANSNVYDDTYTITVPSGYSVNSMGTQIAESKLVFFRTESSNHYAIIVDVASRNVSSEITIPNIGSLVTVCGSAKLEVAQKHTDDGVGYISIYDTDTAQWVEDIETAGWDIDQVLKIGGRYYFREISQSGFCCANDGVLAPTNYKWLRGEYNAHGTYLPTMDKLQFGDDYGTLDRYLGVIPMYLATINNLEEEIVKDNTKTMKITYVLTRR